MYRSNKFMVFYGFDCAMVYVSGRKQKQPSFFDSIDKDVITCRTSSYAFVRTLDAMRLHANGIAVSIRTMQSKQIHARAHRPEDTIGDGISFETGICHCLATNYADCTSVPAVRALLTASIISFPWRWAVRSTTWITCNQLAPHAT